MPFGYQPWKGNMLVPDKGNKHFAMDGNIVQLQVNNVWEAFYGCAESYSCWFLSSNCSRQTIRIFQKRRRRKKCPEKQQCVPDRLLRGLKQNKTKGVLRWRRKKPDLDKVSSPAEAVSVFSDTRLAVAGNIRCLRLQWQISGSSPTFLHKKEDFNLAIFK